MDLTNLNLSHLHDSNTQDGIDIHSNHSILKVDMLEDTMQERIIINNHKINVFQDFSGLPSTNHSICCSSTPVNLLSFPNSTSDDALSNLSPSLASPFSLKSGIFKECQLNSTSNDHIGSTDNALGCKSVAKDDSSDTAASFSSSCGTHPTAIIGVLSSSKSTAPLKNLTRLAERREKTFTCQTCNKCFGYKHVLQHHERIHTGEKPFECSLCQKRFTRDHHLKTHQRLHTAEKPYHCNQCDRYFVQMGNLRRHLRIHTGERPYPCELCSSRFSDSNQLKHHLLIHRGEKPFECSNCLRRFRRRHRLLHHKCTGRIESSHVILCRPVFSEEDEHSKSSTTKTESEQSFRQKCIVVKTISNKSINLIDSSTGILSTKVTPIKSESSNEVKRKVKKELINEQNSRKLLPSS